MQIAEERRDESPKEVQASSFKRGQLHGVARARVSRARRRQAALSPAGVRAPAGAKRGASKPSAAELGERLA